MEEGESNVVYTVLFFTPFHFSLSALFKSFLSLKYLPFTLYFFHEFSLSSSVPPFIYLFFYTCIFSFLLFLIIQVFSALKYLSFPHFTFMNFLSLLLFCLFIYFSILAYFCFSFSSVCLVCFTLQLLLFPSYYTNFPSLLLFLRLLIYFLQSHIFVRPFPQYSNLFHP